MESQIPFSGMNQKNVTNMSFAELAKRVVKAKSVGVSQVNIM